MWSPASTDSNPNCSARWAKRRRPSGSGLRGILRPIFMAVPPEDGTTGDGHPTHYSGTGGALQRPPHAHGSVSSTVIRVAHCITEGHGEKSCGIACPRAPVPPPADGLTRGVEEV